MIYTSNPLRAVEDFKKLQEKKALRKAKIAEKKETLKRDLELIDSKGSLKDSSELQKVNRPAEKPMSDKQLAVRLKFGMATQFLNQVRKFITMAYRNSRKGPMAPMVSHLIKECFIGEYPTIEIDYSKVRLGPKGSISTVMCQFDVLPNCSFYIYWRTEENFLASPDDKWYFIGYNIDQKKFFWSRALLRSEESATVVFEDQQPNERFVLYVFVINSSGKKSTNRFLGEGRFR